MAEVHSDPGLFAECLAAMAASGDAYPCDMLAPPSATGCALPEPSPVPSTTTAPSHQGQRT
jgi:hypothetical protein